MALRTRKYWIFFGVLVLFGLAGLLALPTLLGSRWIYQSLLDRLEADDFHLEVAAVRLRWFTPISLEGIEIRQEKGPTLLSIEKISSNRGLLGFLIGGRHLGRVTIDKPTIDIELLSDTTNLHRLIRAIEGQKGTDPSISSEPKKPGPLPAVDLEVEVKGLSAKVQRPGEPMPLVIVPPWDVHVDYHAKDGESKVHVEPTSVLDNVELTPELIKLGLGHALPLLADSAWFEGRISLRTEAIDIPLNDPVRSTGKGVVILHSVRSGPSQPAIIKALDLMAQLRDREPSHELVFVDGSQVQIQVTDGKVYHQGLEAGLPKVDERLQIGTSGGVGLQDKSLDLTLHFPVPLAMVARREEVREMGVPIVRVPLVGTLDAPKVQWNVLRNDSADLFAVIGAKLENGSPGTSALLKSIGSLVEGESDEAIGVAVDKVKEFLERRKNQRSVPESKTTESGDPTEKQPSRRPVRDALRDLFRTEGR